jgi:hypothetical protein
MDRILHLLNEEENSSDVKLNKKDKRRQTHHILIY